MESKDNSKIISNFILKTYQKETNSFKNNFETGCISIKLDINSIREHKQLYNIIINDFTYFRKVSHKTIKKEINNIKEFTIDFSFLTFPYYFIDIYSFSNLNNLKSDNTSRLIYFKKIQIVTKNSLKSFQKKKSFKINCQCFSKGQKVMINYWFTLEDNLLNKDKNRQSSNPKCKICGNYYNNDEESSFYTNYYKYNVIILDNDSQINEQISLYIEEKEANKKIINLELGSICEGIFVLFLIKNNFIKNEKLYISLKKGLIGLQIQNSKKRENKIKATIESMVFNKLYKSNNILESTFNGIKDCGILDINYNKFLFSNFIGILDNCFKINNINNSEIFIDWRFSLILLYLVIFKYYSLNNNQNYLLIGIIVDSFYLIIEQLLSNYNFFTVLPHNINHKLLENFININKDKIIIVKNFNNLNKKIQKYFIRYLTKKETNNKNTFLFIFNYNILKSNSNKKNEIYYKYLSNCTNNNISNYISLVVDLSNINNKIILNKDSLFDNFNFINSISNYYCYKNNIKNNTNKDDNKKQTNYEKSVISYVSSVFFNKSNLPDNKNNNEILSNINIKEYQQNIFENNIKFIPELIKNLYDKINQSLNKIFIINNIKLISEINNFIRYKYFKLDNSKFFESTTNYEAFDLFISLLLIDKSIYVLYEPSMTVFDKELILFENNIDYYLSNQSIKSNSSELLESFEDIYNNVINYLNN